MRPRNPHRLFRVVPAALPDGRAGAFFSRALALAVFCLLSLPADGFAAARSSSEPSVIERQITREQERAKARRESLSRLTDEERRLDGELAAAESKILRLEASLTKEERMLAGLAASDAELAAKGEALLAEMAKTETAMTEALRLLWELHARREGVKGRDLPDWPVTDREHAWSLELFASLDGYRKSLAEQRKNIDAVAAERSRIAREVQRRVASLSKEKEDLLQSRVRYGRHLAELREEKRDTEQELTNILALVHNLNLRQQAAEAEGDIAKVKGRLPWPVSGKVQSRYNPSASPPVRGLTLALDGETPVRAVHSGKVVHNDVLRGIGRVVILMHGEEYYSLYAFLSESALRVGQEVARGDVLGSSGFVTSLNGPGLYFELRFHQKAVN
ncbi:MAG: peptidoglycan DD-metalloendopeptidase family protein, partial [Deltaproteobacteria bacterium]|nr:peptidoglycan DD-metalloendopeptidase family protein [Deltaproteobacteria bacterium]